MQKEMSEQWSFRNFLYYNKQFYVNFTPDNPQNYIKYTFFYLIFNFWVFSLFSCSIFARNVFSFLKFNLFYVKNNYIVLNFVWLHKFLC